MHIFAATLANAVPNLPIHGLSVLNDCKYGFDVKDDLFRLTVLRSSADPDKNPDEGRQLFTYSLYPHAKGWRDAHCEQQGLALNVPLEACLAMSHAAAKSVPIVTVKTADDNVIAGALKHAEDGDGYILRLYETQGCDSQVQASFDRPIAVEETDLLERPLKRRNLSVSGRQVTFPIGHDQIVTLHVVFPH
jgi:alpha-mannosidase